MDASTLRESLRQESALKLKRILSVSDSDLNKRLSDANERLRRLLWNEKEPTDADRERGFESFCNRHGPG